MFESIQNESIERLTGYSALIARYGLEVIPNWHSSTVINSGIHRIDTIGGQIKEVYPPKYWPGDMLGDHLEFALKYDGTNLGILASLFRKPIKKTSLSLFTAANPYWLLFPYGSIC